MKTCLDQGGETIESFSLTPLSEDTLEESIRPYLYYHCNDLKLRKMGSAQSQNRSQGSQHFHDRKTLLCEVI